MSDKEIEALEQKLLEQQKLVSSSKEAATALLKRHRLLKEPKQRSRRKVA